jgi:REP element-mobilizing transposase RayT
MTSYPEHLSSFDYVGAHRYFLTFCTFERRRHFTETDHVDLVRTHFAQQSKHEHFEIPAYCFLPDHVHVLVEGTQDDSDLKQFIKSAKQYSGFYFSQKTQERLWQRYGFERVWMITPSGDHSRIHERSWVGAAFKRPVNLTRRVDDVSRCKKPPSAGAPPGSLFPARIGSRYFSATTSA